MQKSTTILGIIEMRQRGISYNDCCNRFHVGHSTIERIMTRYNEIGKDLSALREMSPEEIETAFYPPENTRRKDESVMPDYSTIYDRIMKEGSRANLYFMWLKYKKEHPSGYQYTQFCHYFNLYVEKNYGSGEVSMAVERVPGEKVYIDWIGDQPELLVDRNTGEMKKVHFFVTTVGVSSLVYAEAFENEKISSFISGTVHALDFYGAVPKHLVPDNVKTAVTKHTKDELLLNSVYQDLESFYDVIVLPPPPRKPKGKPTVEKHVQFLETHLLEDLKERTYFSIEDINRDVKEKIAEINNRKLKGQSFSRMDAFLRYDKPQMRTLAGDSFALCEYKYFARVPNNYHLLFDDHYYSVLYTYYGQPAILKATMAEIRICDENNKLICTHHRSYEDYPRYITDPAHMPQEHLFQKEVNSRDGAYYRRWASSYGPYMEKLIDAVLLAPKHEEQAYNSCNGILHMCTERSRLLVEEAARICVESNACRYTYFKKTLLNLEEQQSFSSPVNKLPEHKNLRGKEIYH